MEKRFIDCYRYVLEMLLDHMIRLISISTYIQIILTPLNKQELNYMITITIDRLKYTMTMILISKHYSSQKQFYF